MAIRGKRPKPTALRVIEGNRSRKPYNKQEPVIVTETCPEPPHYLTDGARAEWNRQAPELFNAGILTVADKFIFAAYCSCVALVIECEEEMQRLRALAKANGACWLVQTTANGSLMQATVIGIANVARRDAARYACELGMTPSARSRIKATPPRPAKKDPAAEFFG